ncbi:uracil-DNA glycosylase [Neoasaia chiangmaiensis NBRC 101099]|uniref:Type-4 uracil-DNA glycosylase n=1 Tax=Neoasaia chiangmaiensis TaxID=320497 RepID=A0A1U9KSD3_9PROT|nr:UdgX family uracil-DNA binding protein [Neoasaia chiangmaiensis]AQS88743.1 hypothetical protein A0U93_13360 [Neoasaia chiangmaiensis]GBR40881.1 uracil-DNA glycosylase [Neoasaia chiangmaiensis NBRC 101099]GEN13702.1 uracil-DNA glycosylase [Neoasaia chiangmaiensis]
MKFTLTQADNGRFETWRHQARQALQAQITPEQIEWRLAGQDEMLWSTMNETDLTQCPPVRTQITLRPSTLKLLEDVIRHRDPDRFTLAYRLAWRSQAEPNLMAIKTDSDVVRAYRMQHQVRRDAHKMKAFLRFREHLSPAGDRRQFLAWFEPEHHILEVVAPFFTARFADMDWVILTPRGSIAWDGTSSSISLELCAQPAISDDMDALWLTYYESIFNPARIKTKAMRAEMPKRYWKNLPEASAIPHLLATAEARVLAMAQQTSGEAPAFHQRLTERQAQPVDIGSDAIDLPSLRHDLTACRRCALHCHATQTVPGTGPDHARLMIIGEQPGDQEDLKGTPFVGPAGQVLNAAMRHTGLDRHSAYLTNAVKHFKFAPRGKRRIHQTPTAHEVDACRWWLRQEIAIVRPSLIVTLGATALKSLTNQTLAQSRGRLTIMENGTARLATIHPSYLLRLPDAERRQSEEARFHADLQQASKWLRDHATRDFAGAEA